MNRQESINHDIRQVKCFNVTKYYVHNLLTKSDFPRVFNSEKEAINWSIKNG